MRLETRMKCRATTHDLCLLIFVMILIRLTKLGREYFHERYVYRKTILISTFLLRACINQHHQDGKKEIKIKSNVKKRKGKERFPIIHYTMVVIPLYLGLVLSGESPSSIAFLLLLFDCCGGVGGSNCSCSCSCCGLGNTGTDCNRS